MSFKFTWELYFDMPKWIEKIHDYVWEPEDEDE
jgi:hypothetical protein